MPEILQQVTLHETAQRVIKIAHAIAKENSNSSFDPAHVLKALLHPEASLRQLLKKLDKDIFYLDEWADVRMECLPKTSPSLSGGNTSPAITSLLNEADHIRLELSKENIEPVHLLAALSTPGVCFSYEQLKSYPLKRDELINAVVEEDEITSIIGTNSKVTSGSKEGSLMQALAKYCTNKSVQAKEARMDKIIGRNNEIRMMSEILCRRSKPNVLIVGDPGVGKSALVDGFADAIEQGKVPKGLTNAIVFELEIGALIAGASYKGEIEDRLKNILEELKRFDKAILFIDEIHMLADKNGAAAGAANLLKPELARGEITLIGATTLDEYRKFIQTDEAFNRRFELLTIAEPNAETCFRMAKAVMPYYEQYHSIQVADETIREAIRLARRYVKDRRLPDAALDLLDRSMAALQMINDTGSCSLEELRKEMEGWQKEDDPFPIHRLDDWQWLYTEMKNTISPILWASFESKEDPSSFTEPTAVIRHLQQAFQALIPASATPRQQLKEADVAAVVSYKTGIPLGKIKTAEKERLLQMETILKQRVIGQDRAIKTIADAILETRSGLNKTGQPIGSFFFMGPTGTGKTELTKALAEFLFHDEGAVIRFDMSEFKEEHAAALLYGAPPGYVGYEEGGLLVNKIRQKPYAVVLFDEIEKAHASVFDVFLQIMDEGKLHDKLGKEGDFSNALIIFTSNIGSQYVEEAIARNEVPSAAKLLEIMAGYFRPEFLGRLTEMVPFVPMTQEMVLNILQIQLKGLKKALHDQGIQLTISGEAACQLAQMGFTPQYGARPLSGVIRTQLRRPLSRKIISGEIGPGASVHLQAGADKEFCWLIENSLTDATPTDELQPVIPATEPVEATS